MHIAVRHSLQIYDPADASLCEDAAIVLPVREADAVMGETVAAYLDRVAWHFDLPTVLTVNGEYLGRGEWAARHIGLNDNVAFVSRPLGGGGSGGSTSKSLLSVVALVALTAVAGPAGALGGFLTSSLGATLGSIASAVIVGAGALAISYFLSPKKGGKTDAKEDLYSFGLGGNAARPMQPIPVLNGRLRFAPDYAAPTYSEYDGDRMIDYALYGLTCGRMRVEQLLIGDTPIWDYQNGPSPDFPGIELQIVEPGEQVTLYPVNVVTADELSGVELTTTFTPGYIVNAAGTIATQLLLDFVWAGGCYRTDSKGKTLSGSTHILVRVRSVDAAGAPTGPWTDVLNKIHTFAKQTQIRITERVAVQPGRYEVSVRRVNEPFSAEGGLNGQDDVTWTALRAHIEGPQAFPRVTTLALKGVASKALSGVSGGQLRVIGTRILPVWRDGLFVDEPTRSIAWAALDWWRNGDYAAGLSLSDTDFQAFVAYDALWQQLGHTFDHRFTEVQNLDEVLETVLKAGRAFPAPVGDKLTITRDQPRGLSRMLFTENDILRDSLEIDYALSDEAWADGIVGEYVDESTWRLAEVSSAPDGVQLLKPARVQIQGVVNRTQAIGLIRFMAAESQYRRITVGWTARMEGRLLKRGDLVKVTAEEPEIWGQSCEIEGVTNEFTLALDPPPEWNPNGNHYVEIRRRDGRPFGPVRVTRGATHDLAILNTGDVNAVEAQQGVGLADVLERSPTQERPWLAFSPGQPRTFPVLITEGDPDQDGEHIHLKGVLDAPEVYTTTESGVPPLLQIPDLFSSAMPVIIGLSARISQRQLALILSCGWQPARNAVSYLADVSYDAGLTWIRAYEGDRATFEAVVGGSDQMRVRVAGVTPAGARGAFYIVEVTAPDITVDGDLLKSLTVRIEALSEATQAEIRAISDLGRGLLALDPDTGEVAIDLATDTIRGGMRQLATAHDNLAQAQATEAADHYLHRALVKLGDDANFAAIERVDELRISDKESFNSITTSLASRLTLAEGDIVADSTIVQGLSTFVSNIDGRVTAQASSLLGLQSQIDASNSTLGGQATAIQGLTTRVTQTENGMKSFSQAVTYLSSVATDQNNINVANAQAAQALTTYVGQVDGRITSQSSSIEALNSAVGSQTATLTTFGQSIDGVKVQYGIVGNIDGVTGGFVFSGVRRLDGVVEYGVKISGDLFVDGSILGRHIAAYTIETAQLTTGQLIVNGQIFDNAVSTVRGAQSTTRSVAYTFTNTRAGNTRLAIFAFYASQGGPGYDNTTAAGNFEIRSNGALRKSVPASIYIAFSGNRVFMTAMAICVQVDVAPGTYTFTANHTNSGGVGSADILIVEISK